MPPPPLSRTKRTVSLLVLILIVLASATQTEIANYLGAQRGYSKPYFTFFLTHSSFTIIFPIHLFILKYTRNRSRRGGGGAAARTTQALIDSLRDVTAAQLRIDPSDHRAVYTKILRVVLKLTALISLPSISWYIAVPLTGTTDLTTIYATATFWTYGFSLLLLRTPLSRLILFSILIAFSGVLLITYSGVKESRNQTPKDVYGHLLGDPNDQGQPPHRILGNLIMLFGAVVLGFYEVVYKLALPEGHGGVVSSGLDDDEKEEDKEDDDEQVVARVGNDLDGPDYQAVSSHAAPDPFDVDQETSRSSFGHRRSTSDYSISDDMEGRGYPLASPLNSGTRLTNPTRTPLQSSSGQSTKLPLALHANMLTSLIGVMTLLFFWIPIPFLHWVGWESFELPWGNWGTLSIVCLTGAVYNAGFMVLIGLLGPTTASVANLLTIGLVALADAFFLGHSIPFWTLIGAGLVGSGFAMLLWAGEEDASAG